MKKLLAVFLALIMLLSFATAEEADEPGDPLYERRALRD